MASTPTNDLSAKPPPSDEAGPAAAERKPIHCLVIDAGPIIKNDPPVSTLLLKAQELYTIPSVVSEIRDAETRARFDTTLRPFLKLRTPRPESVKFVTDFARKTGDLEVLSKSDIHLIALTYDLECERNEGDWRLRKTPAQKGVNGKPPWKAEEVEGTQLAVVDTTTIDEISAEPEPQEPPTTEAEQNETTPVKEAGDLAVEDLAAVGNKLAGIELVAVDAEITAGAEPQEPAADEGSEDGSESDASDGWITPSNLKKQQQKDGLVPPTQPLQRFLQVAILTSDYAMQNVSLRINLNLLNPSFARITQVKTWVQRCHGCFTVTRKMDKQFCPACGQATLTRTSCSTDQSGNFRIHLKRNFQFNKRGNVFSVPKPVHGTSNGKNTGVNGGGKAGWGRELILAEDQKEYVRKAEEEKRTKYRDLMDEDYLPNILTGNRKGGNGRIPVGAGRNVNSKKRF